MVLAGIDLIKSKNRQRLTRTGIQSGPIDKSPHSPWIVAAKKDVFSHAELRNDTQFLMNEARGPEPAHGPGRRC